MATGVSIMSMPCEIMVLIMEYKDINMRDVVNLSLTCKHFNKTIKEASNLWKIKFFQRWPVLRDPYKVYEMQFGTVSDWFEETMRHMDTKKRLISEISMMSIKFHGRYEFCRSELAYLDRLFREEAGASLMASSFLIQELIDMLSKEEQGSNLTLRYYARKVLRYIRQRQVADEWSVYMSLPPEMQTMEKGALILARWCQPMKTIDSRSVTIFLDLLANESKGLLKTVYPNHPIFSVPAKWFKVWEHHILEDNQWLGFESRRVLEAICEVMFHKHGFDGRSASYYIEENSYINCVLQSGHGTGVSLAIIFEAVARRLGVRCDPICFPTHFLLRWKERYDIPDTPDTVEYYIDVFNSGNFVSQENCPRIRGSHGRCPIEKYRTRCPTSARQVAARMALCVETAARQNPRMNGRHTGLRSALELRHLIEPQNTHVILQLGRFYVLHEMDVTELVNALYDVKEELGPTARGQAEHILQMLQVYQARRKQVDVFRVKRRVEVVKFAVGMIVVHQVTLHMGVVVGWDLKCDTASDLLDEQSIKELRNGRDQPFYTLLLDDGTSRYVAQEHIAFPKRDWKPVPLENSEVGRFFDGFNGTYYIPNELTSMTYPEDAQALILLKSQLAANQSTIDKMSNDGFSGEENQITWLVRMK